MTNPTGTIAVAADSQLQLGGAVHFDVTFSPATLDSKPHQNGGVQIQLEATNPETGERLYLESKHYDQAFILGDGAWPWAELGGAGHCRADLYVYDQRAHHFVFLAFCEFDATVPAE